MPAQSFWFEAQSRYRLLAHDVERPILTPETLLIKADEFFNQTQRYSRITLNTQDVITGLPELDIERRAEQPLHKLSTYIKGFKGRILIQQKAWGAGKLLLSF
jgi:transcription-repair coupling factor (superfamily II helicase)